MNPFAAMLYDGEPELKPMAEKPQPKKVVKPVADRTEAKAIYATFLIRSAYLKQQQAYAERVAKATDGPSMTPVMPLATMGTNGGALLCDHCRKPIILEGGKFHGKYANEAWEQNPDPRWKSWIKGGLMVIITDNGTLRIYHGYAGNPNHCYAIGKAEQDKAEAAFIRDNSKTKLIVKFLEAEFPDRVNELLTDIMNVMFSYDPGYGVNKA